MKVIGFNGEWQKLKERVDKLRKEIVTLTTVIAEKKRKGVFLRADYQNKIGVYEYERFKCFFECRKLRRKIEILQQAKNRDEVLSEKAVEEAIKVEVEEFEDKLRKMLADVKRSAMILESPTLTQKQMKEIKDLYKFIVKKLHPDLNPVQTFEMRRLWEETLDAYERNDLEALKDVYEEVKTLDTVDDEEELDSMEKLSMDADKLTIRKKKLRGDLEEMERSFPFNQESVLESAEKTAELIDSIKCETEEYKKTAKILTTVYESYFNR